MAFKRSKPDDLSKHQPNDDVFNEDIIIPGKPSNTIKTTIGVAGCMSRIGTTTVAMKMVSYLIYHHKNVAYVEANNSGFIDDLKDVYTDIRPDGMGNSDYGVFKLVKRENIQSVMTDDFDFFVFDYGSCFSPGFDAASFSERNIQVLVTGYKPLELYHLREAMKGPAFRKSYYIFNETPLDDQKNAMKIKTLDSDRIYFMDYQPDYFAQTRTLDPVFGRIINLDGDNKKG